MPFRLARALRAHFAAAVRNRTARKGLNTGSGAAAPSRCAAEPLEDRRLLTVSILTPYQHDVEGNTAAFFADFTSDARPGDAYVGWGDGTIDQLENRMMDYDPATGRGRVYRIHPPATGPKKRGRIYRVSHWSGNCLPLLRRSD